MDPTTIDASSPLDTSNRTAVARSSAKLQERSAAAGQSILVVGLGTVLMFAVLAFGSVDEWAISILEIGSALVLLVWLWPQIFSGRLQLNTNALCPPVVLFGLVVAAQVVLGMSAYGYATRHELWKYAAYGALFLLVSQCGRAALHKLLRILAAFGFMVALFAIIQYLTNDNKVYWYVPVGRFSSGFGPYFNQNHYAGLMEMLAPIPFAMALLDGARPHQQLFWTIAGSVMAATIFVCGSRGGMIAFAVQMVLFATFFVARKSRRTAWSLLAICLAIGSFAFWIDNGALLARLDTLRNPLTDADVAARLTIARDSLRMVRDRPIIGWGLGLFPIVYPQYRGFSTDLVINQAHNDYVQALVESGILGFACLLWFVVSLYRSGIRNLRAYSGAATLRVLGPLVGCTGILVHSLSDFNLHIPANAALFFVLCGIASGGDQKSRRECLKS